MKYLALSIFVLTASVVNANTLEDLLTNKWWSVQDYNVGYCEYEKWFFENAEERGIEVDTTDEGIRNWIQVDFAQLVELTGVTVMGSIDPVIAHNCE